MEGQGHFLTLAPGRLHMKIKACFLGNYWAIFNQILYVSFRYNEMKINKHDAGLMTKVAIYGKNPSKIFFSGTGEPIYMKLGLQHRGLQPIIVCSNNDPWLTLTYFTARSNLVN